jgi:hypothetical protein
MIIWCMHIAFCGSGSVVGIAIVYRLDGPGIVPCARWKSYLEPSRMQWVGNYLSIL